MINLESDIKGFFDSILDSDFDNTYRQAIIKRSKDSEKQKSNILVLTTDCNIDCDYCYQKQERQTNKHLELSTDYIDKFLLELVERESNCVSTVVLFGGEPFLRPDLIYYVMDKIEEITNSTRKQFALSCTTNGIYFLNNNNFNIFKEKNKKL